MAFMAVLESDLRSLSSEARRRYPSIKDGAEHAILKIRSLSTPSEIAHNEDILKMFLMACEVKSVKLSVIALSSLQKLISHDAVVPSALKRILSTLNEHAEMLDESIQLKTLQTILIIFQSHLHPENEEDMAQALAIPLRLLESFRSSDNVRNTAAATLRQAIALIFDHMVSAECLPSKKLASEVYSYRSASKTADIICNINNKESIKSEYIVERPLLLRDAKTESGKLGLQLLEDLAALAAGGHARWLHVSSFQRTFALDILEFILSNFAVAFITLDSFQQVLRRQICSLLMTSLRVNIELEGEVGEPSFRRLVLRSVAHIVKLYSTPLITECEVFLSMLIKVTMHDVPLWHHILVLEVLRGFCVEARTLQILYENFDMNPDNTNVVEEMVKALAMVVSTVQVEETSEESLAAVAGMFSSKAIGVEWSLENDTSNAAVVVASEADAVTLAIEGLLGVVFTIATLTNEVLDTRELDSPRCRSVRPIKCTGRIALLCTSMVDSLWLIILHALSLILARSQSEAIIVEILKGYQAFTQACGILHIEEPLNSYLASLCKFAVSIQLDPDRSVLQSPRSKRSELLVDQRDSIVLTPKNVQALRTLFNIAHRLHNVLGPSWVLVLETLAALDRVIHSPAVTFKDSSAPSPKLMRESSGHYSDFTILSSLNSQLFESSSCMHISAVNSLVSALSQLTIEGSPGAGSSSSMALSSQKFVSIRFSVERMLSILMNNLHRTGLLWDKIAEYFIELANNSDQPSRVMALDGLDRAMCGVLASNNFERHATTRVNLDNETTNCSTWERSFEFAVISPLRVLYFTNLYADIRAGSLKILQHVLERCREKLLYVWPNILEMLRYVADASDKELIAMGFQNLLVIMNDGLSIIPAECLNTYIDVTGAYSAQKTELNVSLTAIGLLWTTSDFIAKKFPGTVQREAGVHDHSSNHVNDESLRLGVVDHDKLLFLVFALLKNLSKDERPEVRNSALRTFFQSFCSHGQKLSESLLVDCFWNNVFPLLERASHMATTSSKDEWQGKELGVRGGKTIHMLIHHSRNTVQKQWDETLVLILGGISRIFRSFFPVLGSTENFCSGWKDLLVYLQSSILNGSKEVAMAAVNCLQTTVISNSLKGTLSMPYVESILEIYHLALQSSHNYVSNIPATVKEEILRCLGELYVHAHAMFDVALYKRLLAIVHIAAKETVAINTTEADTESLHSQVPPMQRAILEILPLLLPTTSLSSMWCFFVHELLLYLPHAESSPEHQEVADNSSAGVSKSNCVFVDQLVPVILDLLVHAPISEKRIILPDVVQGLGRCMMTRRECPDGDLWRLAVGSFKRVVVDELKNVPADHENSAPGKSSRLRMWKEIADVFEQFLTGYCGRALPSNSLPPETLEADEALEMDFLHILAEEILKSRIDAPSDILQRLVLTIDRCASRTCSLPLETVELMPPHCSRFSLTCLRKLFSLSSRLNEADERTETTRTEISKISVVVLLDRCEHVLNRYLIDENILGARPFPAARFDELVCVLQELASLVILPETASVLPLHPNLRIRVGDDHYPSCRPHLLVLYPSICDLVTSKQENVREMVRVLLWLVGEDLSLHKMSLN